MPHCLNYKNDAVIEAVSNLAKEMKQKESQTLFQVELWQEGKEIYDRFPTKAELEKFNKEEEAKSKKKPAPAPKQTNDDEEPFSLFEDESEESESILGPTGEFSLEDEEKKRQNENKRADLLNQKARDWKELAFRRHKYRDAETKKRLKEAKQIFEERHDMGPDGLYVHSDTAVKDAERDIRVIESNERIYRNEFTDYERRYNHAVEYSLREGNEEKSITDLIKDFWAFTDEYEKDEAMPAKEKIMEILRGKYEEETHKTLKEKDKDYNPDLQSKEDLPQIAKFMYNLASVGATHADIQALTRLKDRIVSNRNEEAVKADTKIREAVEKLYKENTKTFGQKVKNFVTPFVDRSSMYNFMYYDESTRNKNGELKTYKARISSNSSDPKQQKRFNDLTTAQQDFLKLYDKYIVEFKEIQNRKNANGQTVGLSENSFIKISKSLTDTIAENPNNGLLKNYLKYLSTFGGPKDNVQLYFEGDKTQGYTFREIKDMIEAGVKKNLWSKFHAIYLLGKYKRKAEKYLMKKQHEVPGLPWDESMKESQYGLTNRGRMVSKFHSSGTKYMKDFSGDHGRALREYVQDMIYIKNMEQLVPLVDSIDQYNSDNMATRKNTKAFMDVWQKGYLYKEKTISINPTVDRTLKFLRAWTHLRVMAFNIPAGAFNVIMGKYQTFRGLERKTRIMGEKRYWGNNFKKTQAILEKYKLLSIETGKDYLPRIGHYFDKLMFGLTEIGENYIQGSSIIGQLSTEKWNWLNSKGELKTVDENGKVLTTEQLEQRDIDIRKELEEARTATFKLQGAYSKDDIRNFGHFELGRAISQFRVWMPETYDDRFGKKKIDAYGNKHQGTLNYMATKGWKEIHKDIRDPKFFTSDEYEYQLKRRNLRSAMAVCAIGVGAIAMTAGGGGDDDEETILANQFYKALGEMLFIFNPSTLKFTIGNTFAAQGTVSSFLDVLINITGYYESGKNKGKWKGGTYIERTLPYKNVYKSIEKVSDYSE